MLIWYPPSPCTVTVNKENYFQEYNVYAKYQIVSAKAVVQVDFPTYALSKHKQNPSSKTKCKKLLSSKTCNFVKIRHRHQTSSCKCSMCLHCACKVLDGFSKSSGTSWFPCACTIWALTKPLLRSKVLKKNGYLQNSVILSKIIFMASNFFMQMFKVSALC